MSERIIRRATIDLTEATMRVVSADDLPEKTLASLQTLIGELFGSDPTLLRDGLTTIDLATGERAIVRIAGDRADALIVGKPLWKWLHDPFLISDRFPPDRTKATHPLEWSDEPPPGRNSSMLRAIHEGGNGPLVLGATQAIVDGARLLFASERIESKFARDIWAMLPIATRCEAAISTALPRYHPKINLAILPQMPQPLPVGYLDERMVLDYPEGRYEHNLQIAFEADDERSVQELLLRRSGRELLRMGIWTVAVLLAVTVIIQLL